MKIYLELLFIINYLLDFMILYGTKKLLKINKSMFRIFISCLLGASTTFLIFIKITSIKLFLIKIIISSLMILISFGKNNFFKNIFYFYMISIVLGGTLYLLDLNDNYYFNIFLLIFLSPVIIYSFIKEINNYHLNYKDKYNVTIIFKKKTYQLEGFVDTGNRLASPFNKKSVILTNLKIDTKYLIYIPYKALNTTGVIPCIRPDKILINDKEFKNCLVGLSRDKFEINGLNCILPNKFKEEL